ncbi:MAG: sel1 repeat family protein, partial [Saprospiraceae bacterium]|nr:sel1 repeat family protein [Saprospiraceae bacterium]
MGQEKPSVNYAVPPRTVASIYNPDLLTKEQLIASFVVRLNKFKKLFADIKEAKMEHPEQPVLIVGLRGMGKTTLLLRLSYEVENDPSLNTWLTPLVFNEEEYGITKLFKLWETIAQYLEKKDSRYAGLFDRMDKEYERLKNDVKYEQAALDLLLDALRQQGKKLLLLIDNFGDMFKRFGKQEKQRLREVLMTCPDLRIIAGSSVAAESFFDYGDPLYELFKIERLDGLTKEETEALLLELGKHYPGNPIKEILEKQPQRVETLRRLTGGIPRSMVLLFEIFVDDKDGDAFTDLESVLDRVTPLYKHRMDDLPPQQQEIVNAIALNWDAVSAKEIAQKTRLDSKLVSAQLKQLHQNNIVDVQATHTKNHLYLVHDRFFNIWYLMRMARKGDKNRVLWLIRFLEAWCDEEQLSKRAGKLRKSMLKGTYQPKGAYDFSTALYHAEKHDLGSRYELAKQTERFLEAKDTSLHEQVSRSDMAFFKKAMDCLKRKDVDGAYQELLNLKEKEAQDYLVLCALCRHRGEMELYEQYYQKSIELKAEHPERVIGDVFCDYLSEYTIAEEYYLIAANNGDVKAIRFLGRMYRRYIKNRAKSEEFYRKAIVLGETSAWIGLADLYYHEYKDYKKSEEFYLEAIAIGRYDGLLYLGLMYKITLKEPSKAENFYLQAIEKGETEAWRYLADLYRDEYKNFAKAEEFYIKASEEGYPVAFRNMGIMYEVNLKNPAKAEDCYVKAIEKGVTIAWVDLADIYCYEYKNYSKAEEYYIRASTEGNHSALRSLGWMYQNKLKAATKAEEYFQLALEKGKTQAWVDLAILYHDEFRDYKKAEELCLKASEEGHFRALCLLGRLYHEDIKDTVKAKEYYCLAIEKGETEARRYLGNLYRDEQDYQMAEECYLKAAEEGHQSALRSLGWTYQHKLKDPAKAEKNYRQAI